MKIQVTSSRGHHEAVTDAEVAHMVFDKLTGKRHASLPAELKTKIPDTWQELDALWRDGDVSGYTAIAKTAGKPDMVNLKEFDPQVDDLLFLSPIAGG